MFFSRNVLLQILFGVISFFIVATCHEFTRAAVSTALGDVVPKNEKNLTLNPLKHTEPIGAILFIITFLIQFYEIICSSQFTISILFFNLLLLTYLCYFIKLYPLLFCKFYQTI